MKIFSIVTPKSYEDIENLKIPTFLKNKNHEVFSYPDGDLKKGEHYLVTDVEFNKAANSLAIKIKGCRVIIKATGKEGFWTAECFKCIE